MKRFIPDFFQRKKRSAASQAPESEPTTEAPTSIASAVAPGPSTDDVSLPPASTDSTTVTSNAAPIPTPIRQTRLDSNNLLMPVIASHIETEPSISNIMTVSNSISTSVSDPAQQTLPNNDSSDSHSGRTEQLHVLLNGLKTALELLAESSDAFPPLKSISSGLRSVFKLRDTVVSNRNDLAKLADDLANIESDMKTLSITETYSRFNPASSLNTPRKKLSEQASKILDEVEIRQSHGRIRRAADAANDANFILKSYGELSRLLSQFQTSALSVLGRSMEDLKEAWSTEATIEKLPHVPAATFTAQTNNHGCMEGTRLDVLEQILSWASNPDEACVYWLCGMAGTGKTTIAQTVCSKLDEEGMLGGSFFCSRQTSAEQGNAIRIVPTLATLIARKSHDYRAEILKVLAKTPGDEMLKLSDQFEQLLSTPIRSVFKDGTTPFILVVDALDECSDANVIRDFLSLILKHAKSLKVKFFVTSRPERHLRENFEGENSRLHSILRLHDVNQDIVKGDIRLYLKASLGDLVRCSAGSSEAWPTSKQMERLVDICGNLFIYAATACKYVKAHGYPKRRLDKLLYGSGRNAQSVTIDHIYKLILNEAFENLDGDEITDVKGALAAIVHGYEPFSVRRLGALLGLTVGEIKATLSDLHSVILVPDVDDAKYKGDTEYDDDNNEDDAEYVRTLHASFVDYITDSTRSGTEAWFLPSSEGHYELAWRCFTILNKKLHFNISGCETSHTRTSYKPDQIPKDVQYASWYGFRHILKSTQPLPLRFLEPLKTFCRENFLFWLETLSRTQFLNNRDSLTRMRQILLDLKDDLHVLSELITFVDHAVWFMDEFDDPIEQSTPHTYISALTFAPPESRIATSYRNKFPNVPLVQYDSRQSSQPMLRIRTGLSGGVSFVAMSPDRSQLVSAKYAVAQVWDTGTGNCVFKLEGHTKNIRCLAFSQNGEFIAWGSTDGAICIWNATTGICVQELTGNSGICYTVSFSPDSNFVVSDSPDGTLRIWNIRSGESDTWECHDFVYSTAFSPDGSLIVSGGNTIRLYNIDTGPIKTFEVELGVADLAFLSDNRHVAFVESSYDVSPQIGLWDSQTGNLVHCFPLCSEGGSVVLSPDGARAPLISSDGILVARIPSHTRSVEFWDTISGEVASIDAAVFPDTFQVFNRERIVTTTYDGEICVWNTKELEEAATARHGRRINHLTFSRDGTLVASVCSGNAIYLWHAGTGHYISRFSQKLIGDNIMAVTFSADGKFILSAHSDSRLRHWDINTCRCAKSRSFVLEQPAQTISSIAFSSDATYFAIGYDKGIIRYLKTDDCKDALAPWTFPNMERKQVALSFDGSIVAVGSGRIVKLWNVARSEAVWSQLLPPLSGDVESLALSHDGFILLCTYSYSESDVAICICNSRTRRSMTATTSRSTLVALSPSGEYAATSIYQGVVKIWDIPNESLKATDYAMFRSPAEISSMAFSPDGTHIDYGFEDGMVRVSKIGLENDSKELNFIQNQCHHNPPHPALLLSPDPAHALLSTCDLFEETYEPYTADRRMEFNGWKSIDAWQLSDFLPGGSESPSRRLEDYQQKPYFRMGVDGWIRSSDDKLLFRIPYSHRDGLWHSGTTAIMGVPSVKIDLSRFRHGKSWTQCRAE